MQGAVSLDRALLFWASAAIGSDGLCQPAAHSFQWTLSLEGAL